MALNKVGDARHEFHTHVQIGDEAAMVLKAHLMTEVALHKYVRSRVPDTKLYEQITKERGPLANGQGLLLLAQALSLRDQVPPTCSDILWPALHELNSLRNKLAHRLTPDADTICNKMRNFIMHVQREPVGHDEKLNVMQLFYGAAIALVDYILVDVDPMTMHDVDLDA